MFDLTQELNTAQCQAASTIEGPVLVIAGAGSGKTRTIVYRLAQMLKLGIPAHSILLLTFTRKAARQMLERASDVLGYGVQGVQGGTFHGFAYSLLRVHRPEGFESLSLMDSGDITQALQSCKEALKIAKGDRSFPKVQTIVGLLSKARNKEIELDEVLRREAVHLLAHSDSLITLGEAYTAYKKQHCLLDYDDLLFFLEEVLRTRPEVLSQCQHRYRYIMVDEYQDTNPVQARLVKLLAGPEGNVMAVGDDAQSIYAFRGADIANILEFEKGFVNTQLIRLEENYRSTQEILDATNAISAGATQGYTKHLFSRRATGPKPQYIRPISDLSQANLVCRTVSELIYSGVPAKEIAVLFRAGYQSYHVEMQLNKIGVQFTKYGGIKYTEAAHIKDALAYARLLINPFDFPSFQRIAQMQQGVGAKTAQKLYEVFQKNDEKAKAKATEKYPTLASDMEFIDVTRTRQYSPSTLLQAIMDHYTPRLEKLYPDDWPRREQGLEQLLQIAGAYTEIDLLVSDLSLEEPETSDNSTENRIILSTVHSAKGLEWQAVLLIDLVEDRFPSRHALARPDDFEEERRLMYVACTRAKDKLFLFAPSTIYSRSDGMNLPALPSPFIREISNSLYTEMVEGYDGRLTEKSLQSSGSCGFTQGATPYASYKQTFASNTPVRASAQSIAQSIKEEAEEFGSQKFSAPASSKSEQKETETSKTGPTQLGFCHHKIFGRGKIIQEIPPDKYRVNFPGLGLKVILAAFVTLE